MNNNDGYKYLAGKCYTICKAISDVHPEFLLTRGHYFCPFWNENRQHWWLEINNIIFDPTKEQFPSKGAGIYKKFDGICECSECKVKMKEENTLKDGRYIFCSSECYKKFVGL